MTQAGPRSSRSINSVVHNRFPRQARSVGRARAALRARLAVWGVGGEVAEVAELLLSELMTNAVRHAEGDSGQGRGRTGRVGTLVAVRGDMLRLEVSDASDQRPRPRVAEDEDECGRGLSLVMALSDDWGVRVREGVGKTVWVALRLPARHDGHVGAGAVHYTS